MLEFEHSLPMMLYRAIDTILPRFRRIFSEFGLTETQWRVLRVLWDRQSATLKELAAATLIPAPSLVGVVDRLAQQSLVERVRDENDRRQVFILATTKGRKLEAQVSPSVEDTYREMQQSLNLDTWQALMKGLEALTQISDTLDTPRPVSPPPLERKELGK